MNKRLLKMDRRVLLLKSRLRNFLSVLTVWEVCSLNALIFVKCRSSNRDLSRTEPIKLMDMMPSLLVSSALHGKEQLQRKASDLRGGFHSHFCLVALGSVGEFHSSSVLYQIEI